MNVTRCAFRGVVNEVPRKVRVSRDEIVDACERCAFLHSVVIITAGHDIQIMGAGSGMWCEAQQ